MKSHELEIPAELLPKEMQVIASFIGVAATLLIAQTYGGCRLRIPIKADPQHPLASLIGYENMIKLSDYYCGDRISVPKCERALKHQRNQEIAASHGQKSLSELAKANGMCERQVLRIQAGAGRKGNSGTRHSTVRWMGTTPVTGLLGVARSLSGNAALA